MKHNPLIRSYLTGKDHQKMTIFYQNSNLCHLYGPNLSVISNSKGIYLPISITYIHSDLFIRLARKLLQKLPCFTSISKISFRCRNKTMMNFTKETVVANLYLMKIHILIIKLFIVKEFSSLMMKILH